MAGAVSSAVCPGLAIAMAKVIAIALVIALAATVALARLQRLAASSLAGPLVPLLGLEAQIRLMAVQSPGFLVMLVAG